MAIIQTGIPGSRVESMDPLSCTTLNKFSVIFFHTRTCTKKKKKSHVRRYSGASGVNECFYPALQLIPALFFFSYTHRYNGDNIKRHISGASGISGYAFFPLSLSHTHSHTMRTTHTHAHTTHKYTNTHTHTGTMALIQTDTHTSGASGMSGCALFPLSHTQTHTHSTHNKHIHTLSLSYTHTHTHTRTMAIIQTGIPVVRVESMDPLSCAAVNKYSNLFFTHTQVHWQ